MESRPRASTGLISRVRIASGSPKFSGLWLRVAVFRDVGLPTGGPALGWLAVVLHGQGSGFRDSVEHLITSDPFLPVAVVQDEAEAFHEA